MLNFYKFRYIKKKFIIKENLTYRIYLRKEINFKLVLIIY